MKVEKYKNNDDLNDNQRYMNHELVSGGYITSDIVGFPFGVLLPFPSQGIRS